MGKRIEKSEILLTKEGAEVVVGGGAEDIRASTRGAGEATVGIGVLALTGVTARLVVVD